MAQEYRLVGSADPNSRIDSVTVPGGQTLELNGEPVELNDEQVSDLSRYVQLEPVSEEGDEQVAEYTAEKYPDEGQPAEGSAQQAVAEQPVPVEAQPEPQPEAQRVPRNRPARQEG